MAKLKYVLDGKGVKFYPITIANGVVYIKGDGTQVKLSEFLAGIDSGKADKVASATAGNFAGLDANGNLTDSGKKAADFDEAGAAATVKSEVIGASTDASSADTIYGAKKYADEKVAGLAGALQYKGTVDSTHALPTEGMEKGAVYVVKEAGTYAGKACEVGDYLIYDGTAWDAINGENQVEDKNASLTIGTAVTVATVDGTDIKVTQVEDTTKLECEACSDTTDYADVSDLFKA